MPKVSAWRGIESQAATRTRPMMAGPLSMPMRRWTSFWLFAQSWTTISEWQRSFSSSAFWAGHFAKGKRGDAADAVGGFAKSAVCKELCRSFAFPAQASFAFSRYGHLGGNQLAREYCRRGHFFFQLWFEHGEDFKFQQHQVDMYSECDEFRLWVESLPLADVFVRRRAEEIRRLAPKLEDVTRA